MSSENPAPWQKPMPEAQFELMKTILASHSPIGYEAAMTYGVIKPEFEKFIPETWAVHQFKGNAGIVFDSHPNRDDLVSIMVVGHADKIRLQVRKIGSDGKVWVNTDSFLPSSLIGHEVKIFCKDPEENGQRKTITGATIEALGAIHFASPAQRSGDKGVGKDSIYLELHMHGEDRKEQVEALGLKVGDPILIDRPIKRGVAPDTFYGAYLDNGLGCFSVVEIARELAKKDLKNVRVLYAISTHEEIGRFGSGQLVGELKPDILIATDVDHDYDAAPGIGAKNMPSLAMGKGFTIRRGSVASEALIEKLEAVCKTNDIPYQLNFAGRDLGTDAMAAALAGVDSAALSVGYPIRNMHTPSESGHTGDLLASIHALIAFICELDSGYGELGITHQHIKDSHIML